VNVELRGPTAGKLAAAARVLAAVPGARESLLFACVDLVPGDEGNPVLMEVELTKPQLYFGYEPAAAERIAAAISDQARAERKRRQALCNG
jgi:hypothetical protein